MKKILSWLFILACGVQVIEVYAATPSIAAGNRHSLAVKSDGSAWAWGSNNYPYGSLGNGSSVFYSDKPVQVVSSQIGNVSAVKGGVLHSMALSEAGSLWAWGYNETGALGNGSTYSSKSPVLVSTFSANSISSFSAGSSFSFASKTDGTVWSWGGGAYGELGREIAPYTFYTVPGVIPGLSGVSSVTAGHSHGLALKNDGTVWAWGFNSKGQLGDGSTTYRLNPLQVIGLTGVVTAISASQSNSLALRNDGTVWQWGTHDEQSGIFGNEPAVTVPTQVGGLTSIIAIATGVTHSLALKSDGTVWAWGYNLFGQVGDGTTTRRLAPVQVIGASGIFAIAAGEAHSLALKEDGTILAWGSNYSGQLGLSIATLSVSVPTQIPLYLTPPPAPVNDNFANRTTISGVSGTVNGTVAGATRETFEYSLGSTGISVWWKWIAPASGQVTFNTTGSNIPIGVAVSSDTSSSLGTTFQATAGQEYSIQTYSLDGRYGTVVLSWSLNTAAQADLSISVSGTPSPLYSDSVIPYTIIVANNGTQTATNVIVTDILPPNTVMDAATSSLCSLAANTITCLLGDLVAGASTNISITLLSTVAPQTVNNTISVASDVTDPNVANNSVLTNVSILSEANSDTDVPTLPQWAAIIMALVLIGSAMRGQARNRL